MLDQLLAAVLLAVVIVLSGPSSEPVTWPAPDTTAIVVAADAGASSGDADPNWMNRV
jgi:hypothetical protein